MANDPPEKDPSESGDNSATHFGWQGLRARLNQIRLLPLMLSNQLGIHTPTRMRISGFRCTGNGDTARCDQCGLVVSNWASDMDPFIIHSQQAPHCPFVRSITPSSSSNLPSSSSRIRKRNPSTSDEQDNSSKRPKNETNDLVSHLNNILETGLIQEMQSSTFSHWPQHNTPSGAQMIAAGFFNCNVGDRVICLYCNLICQQWTPHTDDPCEVHRTLSPNCKYVKAKLTNTTTLTIINPEESSTSGPINNHQNTSNTPCLSRFKEVAFSAACNSLYSDISKRSESFSEWSSNENSPPVDDLVRSGFYYTGKKTIVACFYCNGSLQNWGPNDNPMIEHARWFPHCAYAKQLCGEELYRKIQESKRAQQERAKINEMKDKVASGATSNTNTTTNSRQLLIPDESTFSRLVAARLDLPISQRLLDQNFKLSIIKRCWEDQLKLKQDDFVSECDLYVACLILQKQIEHIDDKKENIIIPSVRMKQIREQNTQTSNNTDADKTSSQSSVNSSSESDTVDSQEEQEIITQTTSTTQDQEQPASATPSNPCVLCLAEKKTLACIPCGHLAICVSCGHSLKSCPICHREIEAFVRICI